VAVVSLVNSVVVIVEVVVDVVFVVVVEITVALSVELLAGNENVVDLVAAVFAALCDGKSCSILCSFNGWSDTFWVGVVDGYKGALVSVDVEMIENWNALETVVICCMLEKTETISGLISDWE